MIIHILIFLVSCVFLVLSGKGLVVSLSKIARFLGWKEFVVAFFIMAFGVSIPNLFVGIISAVNHVPELSFGDVIGGNIIDLSLAIGLAALISKKGLSAQSGTVQGSSLYTIIVAVLPLVLISDGILSRSDGILLFMVFFAYIFWLFKKEDRFTKVYNGIKEPLTLGFFFHNLRKFLTSFVLLIIAAEGIVKSSVFFAHYFNFPIGLIGILVVGFGNSLPETFFSIRAARKGQDWMVLGDLMGGVVITATLVLGTVALIQPIVISDFSSIAVGRAFMVISALFFLIFLRTGRKITRKEAVFLILIYILFVVIEVSRIN
ncbi:MAG: sodium:calcium antiporter [Candidatus Parcubacteria bacterium]|nr:sodium:calcium antiporter [Candidatus Parcubacteria bacterium]